MLRVVLKYGTTPSPPTYSPQRGQLSIERLDDCHGLVEEVPKCMPRTSNLGHQHYTVGWICALPKEMAAAQATLDEKHPPLLHERSDPNTYTLDRIGSHNVVLACLPTWLIGTIFRCDRCQPHALDLQILEG
jgi:hypothetical protein